MGHLGVVCKHVEYLTSVFVFDLMDSSVILSNDVRKCLFCYKMG